jgi:hypothetical protein
LLSQGDTIEALGIIFRQCVGSGLGLNDRNNIITNIVWTTCPISLVFLSLVSQSLPVPCFFTALQHVNIQQEVDSKWIFRVLVGSMTHSPQARGLLNNVCMV